jgi:glyoxylase-like metal-dependent hydrolase (beta-lactamase superfamily II)
MRRALAVSVALVVFLAVPQRGSAQNFDEIQISTTPVAGSIYMLQGSGGNIGLSIGDDATILVDDQFAPLTQKIQAAVAALTRTPVDFVINTHWHYDHTDGNTNFGRAGATIVAHENARTRMMRTDTVSLNNRVQEAYGPDGLPKITFYQSMRFHLNDNVIDVIHLRNAHTDGDAAVYFRDANVLHTGDTFTRSALPFIDQPNGGTLDGMIEAAWTMAGLIDDQTRIIPGHGALSTRADLLAHHTKLVAIRDRLREHAARGHTPDQVVAANPVRDYAPEMNAGNERWLRAAYEEYR